jgi:hypothetical protein
MNSNSTKYGLLLLGFASYGLTSVLNTNEPFKPEFTYEINQFEQPQHHKQFNHHMGKE